MNGQFSFYSVNIAFGAFHCNSVDVVQIMSGTAQNGVFFENSWVSIS